MVVVAVAAPNPSTTARHIIKLFWVVPGGKARGDDSCFLLAPLARADHAIKQKIFPVVGTMHLGYDRLSVEFADACLKKRLSAGILSLLAFTLAFKPSVKTRKGTA